MMKFTTTVLALNTLYSADAFMAQTPKHVLQPLHAETLTNGANRFGSNPTGFGANPTVRGTANSPFSPNNPNRTTPRPEYGRTTENSNVDVRTTANSPFSPPAYDSPTQTNRRTNNMVTSTQELFDEIIPVEVQGGSLRTCSFQESVDRIAVLLRTSGRPLNANVELWQGPDNSPQKMAVYLEDGELRPFRCTVESPGGSNAIAIRNTGQMEFPLTAGLQCDQSGNAGPSETLLANSKYRTIQGGAVYTTPFSAAVRSVQIALRTDGRPLNARIELLQGPNNNKQVMEVYTEDGQRRPFYVVLETPGSGNVVRIVNTATVEFPLTASAESYIVGDSVMEQPSRDGGMTWS